MSYVINWGKSTTIFNTFVWILFFFYQTCRDTAVNLVFLLLLPCSEMCNVLLLLRNITEKNKTITFLTVICRCIPPPCFITILSKVYLCVHLSRTCFICEDLFNCGCCLSRDCTVMKKGKYSSLLGGSVVNLHPQNEVEAGLEKVPH